MLIDLVPVTALQPIPVAVPSKMWICGRSLVGIVGSNPAGGIYVCVLCVLCVFGYRSLRRADHSSGGVLLTVVCFSVISKPRQRGSIDPLGLSSHEKEKLFYRQLHILHTT